MSRVKPLQGGCSCGRNHYSIVVPTDATEQAEVYFDDSRESRRSQATPLTAWLRVPITWVSSTTIAQLPDETHSSIRRMFTPHHSPYSKRIFCGYCGTHLSYWTEQPAEEAEYISVTLGSLYGEDLRALKELDLLSDEEADELVGEDEDSSGDANTTERSEVASPVHKDVQSPRHTRQRQNQLQQSEPASNGGAAAGGEPMHLVPTQRQTRNGGVTRTERHGKSGDLSWFEEMIDGSRLGRTQKRRKGMGVSADGSTQVQWEVSEYSSGFGDDIDSGEPQLSSGSNSGKRKISDVGSGDDVPMRT